MRWETIAVCSVCVLGLVTAIPVPQTDLETLQSQPAQVPLDVQERLRSLQLEESALEQVARDKRTIAVLRQLFPGISQLIDRKIAQITQYLFRVIGRVVLRAGLGGGGGNAGGGSSNRRVSITLPTFPPDTDEDDTEVNEPAETTTTEEGATEPNTQTELNPEEENQVFGAESQQNEVRLLPDTQQDQEVAASGGNEASDLTNLETSEDATGEEADRNKRLINFSLGGGASGGSGGSGGGSGNFLFDIIRLVAGSGNTESSDGGATADAGVEKDDGYQAGIPGPITRLFIIANRGIANLIQDLILRIAQTSERIVNFKARLITSII